MIVGFGSEYDTCNSNVECTPWKTVLGIVCPALLDIANGAISYSSSPLFVDVVATYSCDEGFVLFSDGNVMRTCEESAALSTLGVWTGSAPSCTCTSCVCKLHNMSCTVIPAYNDHLIALKNVALIVATLKPMFSL